MVPWWPPSCRIAWLKACDNWQRRFTECVVRSVGRGPIRGQFQRRQRPELLEPVGAEPLEQFALQSLALPDRKIGVLDRQFRQWRRNPVSEGAIGRHQVASQDVQRPAVVDDMVHSDQNHVFVLPQPQHLDPRERALQEIDRLPRLRGKISPYLVIPLVGSKLAQVRDRQRQMRIRGNDLHGPPLHFGERCSQRLVTAEDLIQCLLQGGQIERPATARPGE